jgi:uncharacterized UBP type Zn finger protein
MFSPSNNRAPRANFSREKSFKFVPDTVAIETRDKTKHVERSVRSANKHASDSGRLSTWMQTTIKANADSGSMSQKSGKLYASDPFPASLVSSRASELDDVLSSTAAKLTSNIKAGAGPSYMAARKQTSTIQASPEDSPVALANLLTLAKCSACSRIQNAKFCTECGISSACL